MLLRLKDDLLTNHYTLRTGSNTFDGVSGILKAKHAPFKIHPQASGMPCGNAWAFERGTNVLEVVNTLVGRTNCVLDIDPYGYIVIKPVLSLRQTPVVTYGDDMPIVGDITYSDNSFNQTNRLIAEYVAEEEGVKYDMSGFSDVAPTANNAPTKTGRNVTELVSIDNLQPRTTATLQAIAKQELAYRQTDGLELSFDSLLGGVDTNTIAYIQADKKYKAFLLEREMSLQATTTTKERWAVI